MEEKCPICETIRIEGLDCNICGWEFIQLGDAKYEVKAGEAREYWQSTQVNDSSLTEDEASDEESIDSVLMEDNKELVNENVLEVEEVEKEGIVEKELEIEELINGGVKKVIEVFEKKLLYDQMKEKQIDILHNELQEYKRDLLAKTNRPLVNGLIYMFDDMDKLLKKFEVSDEDISLEKFVKVLKGVREDIEILLEENGVVTFMENETKFNPKRQQVIKKVPIDEKEKVGEIVDYIRPGFEQGNDLIRKERVGVFVYEKKQVKEDEPKIDLPETIDDTELNQKENENE